MKANGDKVSFWDDDNVLELDSDNSFTILWVYY